MNRKANPWVSLAALVLIVVSLVSLCCCGEPTNANAAEPTSARFEITHSELVGGTRVKIITDTETGTQYLIIGASQGYGLTVLQPTPETGGENGGT